MEAKPLRNWMKARVPFASLFIIAGIATGYAKHARAVPGIVAGTFAAFIVGVGALVLVLHHHRHREPALFLARRPLETIAYAVLGTFFTAAVIVIYGRDTWMAWWAADSAGRSWWFHPVCFGARMIIYFIVFGGTSGYLTQVSTAQDKQEQDAAIARLKVTGPGRFALVGGLLVLATLDIVLSLHLTTSSPILIPFGAVCAFAFGIAGALAGGLVLVVSLEKAKVLPAGDTRAILARRLRLATIAALIAAGVVVGAIVALGGTTYASWSWHVHDSWRFVAIVGVALLAAAVGLVSSPSTAIIGAWCVLVGLAALLLVAVCGAIPASTSISVFEIGGFAGGVAFPLFAVIAGTAERKPYPAFDPLAPK